MTDQPEEKQQVIARPIGKIKKAPSFFENPIVQDIIGGLIVPLVKGTILSVVERLLYGDQGSSNQTPGFGAGQVSYQKHFGQSLKFQGGTPANRFQKYQQVRSQFPQLEDLVFETEYHATLVINAMYDRIERFSYASVADLYDIVGLKVPDYTYTQFGWNMIQLGRYELRNLPQGGVQLILPRAFPFTA